MPSRASPSIHMALQNTPQSNRLHIGIFGRRNSGKSTLINALTGQKAALVSPVAGTTTDPVYKAMEIHGMGPVVFIDTAGFDDEGELGQLRVEKTRRALEKTDLALLVCGGDDMEQEKAWYDALKAAGAAVVAVVTQADRLDDPEARAQRVREALGLEPVVVSAAQGRGLTALKEAMLAALPQDFERDTIVGHLVQEGDSVLLVMPQDIQAPKGRLILPQVQTLRDLLDHKCVVTCCTTEKLPQALAALAEPPKLIITDSQVFPIVYAAKPKESRLTSFSVLFAGYKGDLPTFVEGAAAIDALTEKSRVLIAEACTHAPLEEDIGRVKLPRLLRKRVGEGLAVDIVSGSDFPEDLSGYDLIIHCGACMFNRRYVLSRIARARDAGVPITNYGVALAFLSGILDKIDLG